MKKSYQVTLHIKPLRSYEQARLVSKMRRFLRTMPANESQQFVRALHLLAMMQEEQSKLEAAEDAKCSHAAVANA